ncbi:periodic tryptophan protein 1 homolog isoform X2 [Neocloeon triangulifer]|uniref:periodic tryptophan protein 1 homolog isoform X2 n=1 Tax=Neocloeon triangulifer TaxID=2078957 RepID=UPI00286F3B47|nr:periodic tryptophan protein 1 homolog isoform X2 [Neocloeon triangulifer]
MNFVSCVSWVKKGAAKSLPDKIKLNDDELKEIVQEATSNLDDEDDESGEENEVVNSSNNSANPTSDEFNFGDYDGESFQSNALSLGGLAVFETPRGEPEVRIVDEADSDEEDFEIKPEDNLIICGHVEDDQSTMDVYVYNEDEGYLYVHHDIILPTMPLCYEWLNHEPDGSVTNLIAVGTMSPVIEVWDLDIVDSLEPSFRLGKKASKKKKIEGVGHKKSVLCMAWNKHLSHILASGSADKSIILWDLDNATPSTKYSYFGAEVQSIQWHPKQPHGLLTGSCDKTVRLFDCRTDSIFNEWNLPGEVEKVVWNHFEEYNFLASSDSGHVFYYDVRNKEPVWSLEAHSKEVTGLSLSCSCPGLLVTGSMDGKMAVWDMLTGEPEKIDEKDMGVGAIVALSTSPDSPFVVCVGGDKKDNNFTVWQMENSEAVRSRFSNRGLISLSEESMEAEEATEDMQNMDLARPGPSVEKKKKKKANK